MAPLSYAAGARFLCNICLDSDKETEEELFVFRFHEPPASIAQV
jgi:hypothetical protein